MRIPTIVMLITTFVVLKNAIVILNLFQDNTRRWFVILKQIQDDETGG